MIDLSAIYYNGIDEDEDNIRKYYQKHKSFKLGKFKFNAYDHYNINKQKTICFEKTNITKDSNLIKFEKILKEKYDIKLVMKSRTNTNYPYIELYGPFFKLLKPEVRLKILVTFDAIINNLIK
jgi:hypothetical protein